MPIKPDLNKRSFPHFKKPLKRSESGAFRKKLKALLG